MNTNVTSIIKDRTNKRKEKLKVQSMMDKPETRVTLSTRQNEDKQTRVTLSTRQNEDKQTRVTLSTRQNEDKQTITVCY
jgi:hypothetical protein